MSEITINGISIDPQAPKPTLAALSLNNASAKHTDFILLQLRGPLRREQRSQLAKLGARVLESVPGNALVCHYPKQSLVKLRSLPFVSWADVYPGVVKIAPALLNLAPTPGGIKAMSASLSAPSDLDASRVTIDVVPHRSVPIKGLVKQVATAAHLNTDDVKVAGNKLRLTVKLRRLADLAALDEVRHIEKVFPRKLANNVATQIMRVPRGATQPGKEGKGEVVAVADTGFDKGSTTNVHPAFKGRVKKLYALGRAGRKDDPDGHGTHVAGSVLGDGTSTADGAIRGSAPGAKLVLQSVLDAQGGLGGLPDHLDALFRPPYHRDAARVHSNSWGSTGNFGVYDQQAYEVDEFVYKSRDMLICFAAGNDGRDGNADGLVDAGSVTPPGTAKNCLTVGASENRRPKQSFTYGDGWPKDFPADPIKSDGVSDNPDGMVAFSSRGPTNDGRIKPDIVAPGSNILSTRSRVTKSEGWGLSADPLYMFDGGTSMATPLVAGCGAVVRAFLRSQGFKKPSAALMKAALINGAHDLAGQYVPSEAGSIPNPSEGFGRIDLQSVLGPYDAKEQVHYFDEGKKLDTGDREDRSFKLPAGTDSLKATLVWTDPPGEGLQSDLDLVVTIGKAERHGNVPGASSDFDRKNNVEQVVWKNLPAGEVVISVIGHSMTLAPQNYALVVRSR